MPTKAEWAKLSPEKKREIGQRSQARQVGWRKDNPEKIRAANRRHYHKHKEKLRAYKKAWRKAHRDPAKPKKSWLKEAAARVGLQVRYQCLWNWTRRGITVEQVKNLLDSQGWRCAICREEFKESPRLDHDHATGAVRGFLCGKCNGGIGLLKDDAEIVRHAADYLEQYTQ